MAKLRPFDTLDTAEPMRVPLEELFSKTADAVLGVDQDYVITLWNGAAERLIGYKATEVVGRPCPEIMFCRDRTGRRVCEPSCSLIVSAKKGEPIEGCELMIHTKAGRAVWIQASTVVVPSGSPDRFTMVHIFRDVTRHVETETLLSQVQALLVSEDRPSGGGSADSSASASFLKVLTPREQEVLRLIARCESAKGIAKQLRISVTTARNHTQKILTKLGVHTKLEAAALAYRYRHF